MLQKVIRYKDYNGLERVETFYFNFNKAEVLEMELSTTGGMQQYTQRIIDAQDTKSLIQIFKDLILQSYGVKSPDGREFIKSPELSKQFSQTEAYSDFFMSLATNEAEAVAFINGILPQALLEAAAKDAELQKKIPEVPAQ